MDDDSEFCDYLDQIEERSSTASTSVVIDADPLHLEVLKKYFGHSNFRPMQWQIISSLMRDKRDNCAIMSTGYGKSLCYQYPAVYTDKIALVVSPLISLMEDQVHSLALSNIPACFLGSAQTGGAKVIDAIFQKKYLIIYVTPEFIIANTDLLEKMRQKLEICLIAVDEAHCISNWGHDFRHHYRELWKIRDVLPGVPVLAVTATATEKVQQDIIKSLRLKNVQLLKSSYDRPNLYIEVAHKSPQGPWNDFERIVKLRFNKYKFPGPTIVYCTTKKQTEAISDLLANKGIECAAYHAGMSLGNRKKIHEKFIKDQLDVIVATVAFGMGIDKPDVRCIVHYGAPMSIDRYYQEIGRAGRDGEPSTCSLFFTDSDFNTLEFMCQDKDSSHVDQMRTFLYSHECRREFILRHFGEEPKSKPEKCCDVCTNQKRDTKYRDLNDEGLYDFTEDAEKMLRCIQILDGRFGATYYLLFIRGSNSAKLKASHKKLPLIGCGKDKPEKWWKGIHQLLLVENYIAKKKVGTGFGLTVFHLTDKGERFLRNMSSGGRLLLKPVSSLLEQLKEPQSKGCQLKEVGNVENGADALDQRLYSLILVKRNALASSKDCAPHHIISVPDIRQLVTSKPRTLEQLSKCQFEMFSEYKQQKFGQMLIDIITEAVGSSGDVESSKTDPDEELGDLLEYCEQFMKEDENGGDTSQGVKRKLDESDKNETESKVPKVDRPVCDIECTAMECDEPEENKNVTKTDEWDCNVDYSNLDSDDEIFRSPPRE